MNQPPAPPDYQQLVYSTVTSSKGGQRTFDAGTKVLVRKHLPKSQVRVSAVDENGKAEDFEFEVSLTQIADILEVKPKEVCAV